MAETTTTTTPPVQAGDDVQALKDKILALEKEKSEWSKPKDDLSLNDKVKLERDQQDKKSSDSKALESSISFNLTVSDFVKQNESFFSKGISDIVKVAEKEKYDSHIHRANAIKAGIIQEHFSLQANVDELTESQKSVLADYTKLTKNGKEEKAKDVWEAVFEPALNTAKRVRKAEELSKSKQGLGGISDSEQAYRDKLSKMAEKKFFRGKNGA